MHLTWRAGRALLCGETDRRTRAIDGGVLSLPDGILVERIAMGHGMFSMDDLLHSSRRACASR